MRVKTLENFLLKNSDFETLINFNSVEEMSGFLQSKGWKISSSADIDEIIKGAEKSLWNFVKEIVDDPSFFDVILLRKDFSNLKAVIRGVLSDVDVTNFLDDLSIYNANELYKNVKKQQFEILPEYIRDTAKEAFSVLLKTSDACLCDTIIDRGMFKVMSNISEKYKSSLIYDYVELLCVSANINIATRSIKLKKNTRNFLLKALVPCSTFDLNRMVAETLKGKESLASYICNVVYKNFPAFTYKDETENLSDWMDASILCILKKKFSSCFGLDPIFAYVLYKYLEFKNLRLVFKNIGNSERLEKLRERFRAF